MLPSKWKWELSKVYILNLNTTSRGKFRLLITYSPSDSNDRYHLKDIIVGKIYFLLVRIKIKHMELSIIKRESWGSGMTDTSSFVPLN